MNIPNNFRFNNVYSYNCKKNNTNAQQQCMQSPVQNNSPHFGSSGNLLARAIILDLMTGGAISGCSSSSTKTQKKEENRPRHTYASEMDLRRLDEELYGTNVKMDGNKVTIKHRGYSKENEQTTEIPEEYFKDCETDNDKEYLVKRWLVESNKDYNCDNIPYELLKAADDTNFYSLDNHRLQMDDDTKAREKGIKVGKFEKTGYGKPNIINVEIDGKKYKLETNCDKKYDLVKDAATYDEETYYPKGSFAKNIQNIKDLYSGKFVRDGNRERFIPKLHLGTPSLDDKNLIKYGTAQDENYENCYYFDLFNTKTGLDLKPEDVKYIDYIDDISSEKQHAYSYYDEANDTQYLYLLEDYKILKQDETGTYQSKVDVNNIRSYPWENLNNKNVN